MLSYFTKNRKLGAENWVGGISRLLGESAGEGRHLFLSHHTKAQLANSATQTSSSRSPVQTTTAKYRTQGNFKINDPIGVFQKLEMRAFCGIPYAVPENQLKRETAISLTIRP